MGVLSRDEDTKACLNADERIQEREIEEGRETANGMRDPFVLWDRRKERACVCSRLRVLVCWLLLP